MSGGPSSGGNGAPSHVQTHEMVESQNDQMVTQMADKVRQLKSVREWPPAGCKETTYC